MGRKPNSKSYKISYTDEDVFRTLEAIKCGLTISKDAIEYGTPQRTLVDQRP